MDAKYKELLKDKSVIEEINRHKWIESEKAGHDIGFDKAAEDWIKRYSSAWLQYHVPKVKPEPKAETKKPSVDKDSALRTRRARSYLV